MEIERNHHSVSMHEMEKHQLNGHNRGLNQDKWKIYPEEFKGKMIGKWRIFII